MKQFLAKIIVNADYGLKNLLLNCSQKLLFKRLKAGETPGKIIIFRTGSIGDSICALPAISVIRNNFPKATIDILTNSGSADFVSLDKLIDKTQFHAIINYFGENKRILFKTLKKNSYDLFIDLTQYDARWTKQMKTLLFARSLGIKHAFGWRVSQTMLFKKYQEVSRIFINERDRLLALLAVQGLDTTSSYFIAAKEENTTRKIIRVMEELQLTDKSRNIGVVIGSKLERNKWPLDYFKRIIENYTNRDYKILIFGGKEDKEKAETLRINKNIINFCGTFLPLETAEAMKFCSVVITNDTGPMHLSYMVKTPVVALFSSRDFPGKWYPPKDGINKVFRSEEVECSACFKRECRNNICMKRITPQMVIAATDLILKR